MFTLSSTLITPSVPVRRSNTQILHWLCCLILKLRCNLALRRYYSDWYSMLVAHSPWLVSVASNSFISRVKSARSDLDWQMYLSPLAKEKQKQSTPTQNKMSANQRIGHPLSGDSLKIPHPSNFEVPTQENYHPVTGFVQCLVTRVGNNLYHFSHQDGKNEPVFMIGSKLSKFI